MLLARHKNSDKIKRTGKQFVNFVRFYNSQTKLSQPFPLNNTINCRTTTETSESAALLMYNQSKFEETEIVFMCAHALVFERKREI